MTTPDDFRPLWRAALIAPEVERPGAVDALLNEVRRVYANGGAEFFAFRVPEPCLFRPTQATIDHVDEYFREFLQVPAVQQSLRAVRATDPLAQAPEIYSGSAFTLDGELARLLVLGGAYQRFEGAPRAAKELAAGFCDAVFGDRYMDIDLFYSPTPWSRWFRDIAWDNTWFGLDRGLSRLWMLCTTDTD